MVTLARCSQWRKASGPMTVTPFGMTTLVRLLQPQKASSPMAVTSSGITTAPPEPLYFFSTPF